MSFPTVQINELESKLEGVGLLSDLLVQKALIYSSDYYFGDKRINGDPVLEGHLYPVALFCIEHQLENGNEVTPNLVAGALMHDSVEDGKIEDYALALNFGNGLYNVVMSVTKENPGEYEGKDFYEKTHKRNCAHFKMLESAPEESRIISLADRYDNLLCMDFSVVYHPFKGSREFYPFGGEVAVHLRQKLNETWEFYIPFAKKHSPYFNKKIYDRLMELRGQELCPMSGIMIERRNFLNNP